MTRGVCYFSPQPFSQLFINVISPEIFPYGGLSDFQLIYIMQSSWLSEARL